MFLNSQSAGILLKGLSEWNFVEKHPPAPCPPPPPPVISSLTVKISLIQFNKYSV